MKKILLTMLVFSLFSSIKTMAQDDPYVGNSFGLGLGRDYGGIGMRYTVSASRTLGVFGALGYNLNTAGVNAGLLARLNPGKKTCAYLIGMYGYNGVIKVNDINGTEVYGQTYYGPTFGIGLEFHGNRKTLNYFNLELLVPITNQSYSDDYQNLKDSGVDFKNNPSPIGFSLGYHFGN